jgi:hypothetical protein
MLWTIGLFSTSMIGSAATMMILRSNARTAYREAQTKKNSGVNSSKLVITSRKDENIEGNN